VNYHVDTIDVSVRRTHLEAVAAVSEILAEEV